MFKSAPNRPITHRPILSRADALIQLGLKRDAATDEIQFAFRNLAKKVHPDLHGGTDEMLRRLILARDLLMSRPHMRPPAQAQVYDSPVEDTPDLTPTDLRISPRQALFGGDHRFVHDGMSLKVTLPAGLRTGEQIRLKIQDTVGRTCEIFNIDIAIDETLRVAGNDLWTSAEIDRDVLYFGGKDVIATPHGPMDVHVVRGFERGSCLCLQGYGLPATANHPVGNLYVRLEARLPAPRPAAELRQAFMRRWG
jgi:curved DNA-binding protein